MSGHDYIRDGDTIYQRSFAIIRAETDLSRFSEDEADIVVRMVHACGSPEAANHIVFGHNLAFSYTDRERPPDVVNTLYRADPTLGPRNPDGTFTDFSVRSTSGVDGVT